MTTKDTQNIDAEEMVEHGEAVENKKEDGEKESLLSPELLRIQELEEKINTLENEKTTLNDQQLRAVAEMQNVKRRAEGDRVKLRFDGAVSLLTPMTKLMDDFTRAFAHIPEDIKDHEFITSLQAIEKSFQKTMTEQGVEFFGSAGDAFDAHLHDSMMIDPNTEAGKVAQVFEAGVKYKNQVVRHAKVSVGQ